MGEPKHAKASFATYNVLDVPINLRVTNCFTVNEMSHFLISLDVTRLHTTSSPELPTRASHLDQASSHVLAFNLISPTSHTFSSTITERLEPHRLISEKQKRIPR